MNLWDAWLTALSSLNANKLRSSLTILGIVIGVTAVVSLMSVGTGAQAAILSRIQGMGTNLLFVRPGAPTEAGIRGTLGSAPTLTLEDAEAIAAGAPSVIMVAPEASISGQIVSDSGNSTSRIVGVTPEYEQVRNFSVEDGDFVSDQDVKARARVAVLGSRVAQTLFPEAGPVGQSIRVNQNRFEVIGVLKSKGGGGLGFEDDVVMVPLSTLQSRLAPRLTVRGGHVVQSINTQVVNQQEMAAATEQVAAILRDRHRLSGEDDFVVTSQEDIISSLKEATGILTILLGSIAGISLLVGGIGVMNIMLVSVTERTKEIGIRKAVGAKERDILVQFLFESAVLTLSGGVVGIGLGWFLSRLLSGISIQGQSLPAVVSPGIVVLAFSVAAGIGLFFGVYPASRAARLHPIEALRHE